MSGPRPVAPDDLFQMEFLQAAQFSPDGTQVVYVVSFTKKEPDGSERDYSALWLVSANGGSARQLTSGEALDFNPRWSPDGKTLAFISTRKGAPQIYLLPMAGGEAKQLTKLAQGVGGGPVWSPDGKEIAFTASPLAAPPDPNQPYRQRRQVYRFDGLGNLDTAVQDVYRIAVENGTPKRLTGDGHLNAAPQWSPDGREILYTAAMSPGDAHYTPGLRVIGADGRVRDLVWKWGPAYSPAWLPDGKRIAFIGQADHQTIGTKNDLWVIDAAGEAAGAIPQNRSAGLLTGIGGGLQFDMPAGGLFLTELQVAADGASLLAPGQVGGSIVVYRVALNGPERCELVLPISERAILMLDSTPDKLLFAQSTLHDPTQLIVADLKTHQETPLTTLNAALSKRLARPGCEHVLYPVADGTQIEGWLLTPPTGKPPYPTILYIHGGPWGAFGYVYSFDFQMLAGAGYAVLFINHRGSSGYGSAFGTALQGDWGNLDYADQIAGLDDVIAKGLADPDRLGVCGISAGGYGTCWMVGHTHRFKAAVAENPVTNLVTIYNVGDIGEVMKRFMGGKPHEQPDNYARCSPITYAHNCTTPTLLVRGELDYRCPADQSEQFYGVLKDNGCVAEMLRLPNSPHLGAILGPPVLRRAQNEALLGWMRRYIPV